MPETCRFRERFNLSGTDLCFFEALALLHFHLKCRPIKAMPRAYCRSVGFGAEKACEGGRTSRTGNKGVRAASLSADLHSKRARWTHCVRVLQFFLLLLHMYGLLRISHPLFAPRNIPEEMLLFHLRASLLEARHIAFPKILPDSVTRISQIYDAKPYTYMSDI